MNSAKTELLRRCVREAGKRLQELNPSEGIKVKKGTGNFVTAGDKASERILMSMIRAAYPDDMILSEETKSTIGDPLLAKQLWVIDPIDGTTNFIRGRRYSVVSVGYVEKGIIKAGAVYDFSHDELFYAEKGIGAFMNDAKINVSTQKDLSKATVATDNSYDPAKTRANLELILKLPSTPWIQMKGSAVLAMCDVAAGRSELYFHTCLKPWDNAAAFLIATEAGATIKGFKGQKINFLSESVVVGNETLVSQFLSSV